MNNVRVKKIHAYPIPAEITADIGALHGQIMQIATIGIYIELESMAMRPGELFRCRFTLPVMKNTIEESLRVVKIYTQPSRSASHSASRAVGTPAAPVTAPADAGAPPVSAAKPMHQLIEAHFISPSLEAQEHIGNFLRSLQTGKTHK